jgi:4-hydroxy-2-oxoheptanedioate aldolase
MNSKFVMRPSRVLEKLRKGELASCIKINLADSRAVEIAGMADYDCIWSDMEHVSNDWSVIERQILASKIHGNDIIVRVSRGGYSDYIRPLELDATGIMVPHIMSLEDAKRVVKMTKFHPIGRRPLDGGNADGAYANIEMAEYISTANRERMLMIQIEDPEPLEELEKIVALEGIDLVFFGPADFSHGIGEPGNFAHPLLRETMKKIPELAHKHGKFAGTVGGFGNFKELVDMGYQFISVGADVVALSQYFKNQITMFGGEK